MGYSFIGDNIRCDDCGDMPDKYLERSRKTMEEKVTLYVYRVIREDLITGQRGKRTKRYTSFSPDLNVGGLYVHLGIGFPGAQRVLDMHVEDLNC